MQTWAYARPNEFFITYHYRGGGKTMSKEVYKQLFEVLKKRWGMYAGIDIPEFYEMVEELFTSEEAEINNAMPSGLFTAKDLARQMGRDEANIEEILEAMADKGLCWTINKDGARFYQFARSLQILEFAFMPGKSTEKHKKIARLIHAYRKARKLTKKEAMEVLDRAEEAGLIHVSGNRQNFSEDITLNSICNCDRWHCGPVSRAIAKSTPGLFINSGFEPRFDTDLCVACETCIERCPPEALTMGEQDIPIVDLDRCFGCAVCASGCLSEAIAMVNKPDFPEPPKNDKELEQAMKANSMS
jgi:Pyruvate/2-oxoacid:ferredoxin oxidoreductase delta subunit